jgi:glycosyltransferase involved in cell wall biosynthesis
MNKLYDYMAMGRPTLIALNAANNPIAESGGGVTVPPGDAVALANAIEQLAGLPETDLQSIGQKARAYVEQHNDFRILAGRLAKTLNEVVAN